MKHVALVTGISGQDGRYTARFLRQEGWAVVGTSRDALSSAHADLRTDGISVEQWDLVDENRLAAILAAVRPTQIYNFAAYSTGSGMYDEPVRIGDLNGLAVTRILEAIRTTDRSIRFCQASSSELFGQPVASPQREDTPFHPRSPYGAAKLYAHTMVGIYRGRYDLFACSAILFNHESPLRNMNFVTRKVSHAAASIRLGLANSLTLGNLDAKRDWGFAGDMVRAMRLMLEAPEPDDYVVATGRVHSVRNLCEYAFRHVGLDYRDYVRVSASDFRPSEDRQLVGDSGKAAEKLGWAPSLSLPELMRMMVDADLERLSRDGKIGA